MLIFRAHLVAVVLFFPFLLLGLLNKWFKNFVPSYALRNNTYAKFLTINRFSIGGFSHEFPRTCAYWSWTKFTQTLWNFSFHFWTKMDFMFFALLTLFGSAFGLDDLMGYEPRFNETCADKEELKTACRGICRVPGRAYARSSPTCAAG